MRRAVRGCGHTQRLSRHYLRPDESLPSSVIAAITSARDAMCGLHYRRQLFLGLYDVAVHSGPGPYTYKDQQGLDAAQLYFVMMEDVAGVPCPPGARLSTSQLRARGRQTDVFPTSCIIRTASLSL